MFDSALRRLQTLGADPEERGTIEVKGIGAMNTSFLMGPHGTASR